MPRWLICSLLTILFWGAWGVFGKALPDLSAGQSQAFSTLGTLPIMLAVAVSPGFREGRRKWRGSLLSLAAGVLVGIGNTAYYQSIALAKASTAVAFTSLYPIVTIVLGLVLLREKPHRVQIAGIVGSLAAIFLLSGQSGVEQAAWLGYAAAAVALWGGSALVMKLATADVSAELATFWFLGAFIPVGVVILAAQPEAFRWSLSAPEWLFVTLLGAAYGLGNLTLLAAYRNQGKASIVTPLTGLYPCVTIPLAILFFHETIGPREIAGIVVALAAGVALAWERRTL